MSSVLVRADGARALLPNDLMIWRAPPSALACCQNRNAIRRGALFDAARARLLSMPEAIAAASLERRAEIVALLVERVMATRTTGMTGLEWTAPAAPADKSA